MGGERGIPQPAWRLLLVVLGEVQIQTNDVFSNFEKIVVGMN
jgi:hypothetical protein